MKILYIVPAIQHPSMRGGLRHYHFLRALSKNHSVTLLALTGGEVTVEAREELGSVVDRLLLFSTEQRSSRPNGYARVFSRIGRELRLRKTVREMRGVFRGLVQEEAFDVVLFHGKVVYSVIEGFRELPTVVDFCDATSLRLREQLRHAKPAEIPWRLLRYAAARRVEGKLLSHSPHLAFISPRDREAVLGARSRAAVVPNGVDLDYWSRQSPATHPNCIVFTGVMDYAPNEDAALYLIETILPVLRRSRPDLEILIVGRDPTPALVEAGRRNPEVTVTGFVEDVRPYLERARVYVAPIRYASGLQNKILEALAMEVPVVTTPVVAAGLRIDGGPEPPLRVAEGAEAIAASVLTLLENEDDHSRLRKEGRPFVEAHFEWNRGAARLEAMCLEAVGQDGSRALTEG